MAYVDGFVLPVPKANIKAYKKMASTAGKVWMEYGALHYFECQGDDMKVDEKFMTSFPKMVKPKPNEVVFFSFIIYKDKAHRNKVNKKVMADPRLNCDVKNMPFNCKKMAYGGFKSLVQF